MAKKEETIQLQICEYIRTNYPKAVFFSESSGLRVSWGLANKLRDLRSVHTLPDMFIAFPSGRYHGFFIELKVEGTTIWKRNGELTSNKHIQDQFNTLDTLYKLGYAATFGVGFESTKKKIDRYFAMSNIPPAAPEINFEQRKFNFTNTNININQTKKT